MAETEQTEQEARAPESEPAPQPERSEEQAARPEAQAPRQEAQQPRPERQDRPERKSGDRPPGNRGGGQQGQGQRREGAGPREGGPQGERREGRESRGGREGGRGERGDDRRGGDRGRFEGPLEIDIEKLISDPLYLDNQAHGVVSRMRDMDSGTKSQLRRLYNAVRRAVRAPENERQQQFVMLRARLAYTIARHSLRSLDSLEKLLLQVTRKNDARGYERFRDLFEAIVAYNE